MARGPQGQYRPDDLLGAAAVTLRVTTGGSDEAAEAVRPAAARKRPDRSGRTRRVTAKDRSTED